MKSEYSQWRPCPPFLVIAMGGLIWATIIIVSHLSARGLSGQVVFARGELPSSPCRSWCCPAGGALAHCHGASSPIFFGHSTWMWRILIWHMKLIYIHVVVTANIVELSWASCQGLIHGHGHSHSHSHGHGHDQDFFGFINQIFVVWYISLYLHHTLSRFTLPGWT
jgi:hypothetical protein